MALGIQDLALLATASRCSLAARMRFERRDPQGREDVER
jgi:hypothetical protein